MLSDWHGRPYNIKYLDVQCINEWTGYSAIQKLSL